jgi:hypothetical protein
MSRSWFRSSVCNPSWKRRSSRPRRQGGFRPALQSLEDRKIPATGFLLSGFSAATAGVAANVTVTAVNADNTTDTGYSGTVHFSSSDPAAVLPANTTLHNGVATLPVTFFTPGTQTLTASDTVNATIKGSISTAGVTATFNFDTGTPTLHPTMSIPLDQTFGGITAYFSSPNAAISGGFSVQSQATTFYNLSQFSGNYLYPNSVYSPTLDVTFSQPLASATFTYATADFSQNEIPTTVQVTAYQGTAVVGSASSHGVFYPGDTMPQGTLTFDGTGQTFNHILIQIPPAPLAASDMLLDNFVATAPNVSDVIVSPPGQAAAPALAVNHAVFTYDGSAHAASATALAADGLTSVPGTFSFTYNGLTAAPTAAGTYAVIGTFTSSDPSYASGTATGSITISAATPVFSNLSSPTIRAGARTTTLSGHLAAGPALPVGDNVAITLNGVTHTAKVDSGGDFSASFATAALPVGGYGITYAFAGDGANFRGATRGRGALKVIRLSTAPRVTIQPKSQSVLAGSAVSFTAAALANPAPTVQWQVSRDGGKTFVNIGGATQTTLTLSASLGQTGFRYRAIFTNAAGKATTVTATLIVKRRH